MGVVTHSCCLCPLEFFYEEGNFVLRHLGLCFGPLFGKYLKRQYGCATTWRKISKRQHVCSSPMKYSWSRENGSQPKVFPLTVVGFGSSLVYVSGVQISELFTNGPCLL